MPPRSLRTAFSHTSACLETSERFMVSNMTPAVFARWLWQLTQYWSRRARCGVRSTGTDAGCACWAPKWVEADDSIVTAKTVATTRYRVILDVSPAKQCRRARGHGPTSPDMRSI